MANKKTDTERHGFLMFFETIDALKEYDPEEAWGFVCAMADYERYGVVPDFDDRGLRGLWRIIQPVSDKNRVKYAEKCRKSRFSAYVSVMKAQYEKRTGKSGKTAVEGVDYLSYDEWIEQVDSVRTDTDAGEREQTQADGGLYDNDNGNDNNGIMIRDNDNGKRNGNGNDNWNGNVKEGETGEPSDIDSLHRQWWDAVNAGDNITAAGFSNQLYKLGFYVDKKTGEMTAR